MKQFKVILLLCCQIATAAMAADIQLGHPSYGGTGCPNGTADVTLSPDGKELSVLFDGYLVEAGGSTGKRLDRKSCNLSIPVSIPQGYSVSIFQVDYRGFSSVPSGGRNQFNVEYFFAGARGPALRRTFMGPKTDNFTITDNLIASAMVWSRCGDQVNLRINSDMMAMTNRYNEQTLGMIDSTDISSGLIYHIQTRRCN